MGSATAKGVRGVGLQPVALERVREHDSYCNTLSTGSLSADVSDSEIVSMNERPFTNVANRKNRAKAKRKIISPSSADHHNSVNPAKVQKYSDALNNEPVVTHVSGLTPRSNIPFARLIGKSA